MLSSPIIIVVQQHSIDIVVEYFTIHGTIPLEIDIIARKPDENLLHIVEVKTRSAKNEKNYLTAAESVSIAKQRRLISASRGYLNYYNLNMSIQFDIIAVHFNLDGYEIEWIQDAFFPQLRSYH